MHSQFVGSLFYAIVVNVCFPNHLASPPPCKREIKGFLFWCVAFPALRSPDDLHSVTDLKTENIAVHLRRETATGTHVDPIVLAERLPRENVTLARWLLPHRIRMWYMRINLAKPDDLFGLIKKKLYSLWLAKHRKRHFVETERSAPLKRNERIFRHRRRA